MLPLRMLHLLMLMVLLCDVEATCPKDNPLTLVPSEVIAEHGGEFLVNCTSSNDDYNRLFWSNGIEMPETEGHDSFTTWTMPLLDWNITAQCIIHINDSFECSKDLEITLYKNPDSVVLFPVNHTVVATHYVLQCDVLDVAPVQNLTVTWYKDNMTIRTDSFLNTTKTPVSESSLMTVEVSREDNGAVFQCEAQLDFGPNGPKPPPVSESHIVSVHYAPEFNDNTTNVYVREGENVTLSCDAEGNPPPRFNWIHDGVAVTENTKYLSVSQVNVNEMYTCTASNELGQIIKHIFINVIKDVPRAPDVAMTTPAAQLDCPVTLMPAEVVVRFGDRASVNCSTSATDFSGMGWEAHVGGTGFKNAPFVIWTVEKLQDWSIKPKCYITRRNQQCSAEPTITVYKTPDVVSISAVTQGPMVEGVQYLLRSDVINVAPVQNLSVMWYMGKENVSVQTFTNISVTAVNVSSFLTVTPTRDHNGTLFTCLAELHLGPNGPKPIPTILSEPYTAVVHYKPMVQDCPSNYIGLEHYFSLEMMPCRADGNPPPIVHWHYKGMLINQSESLSRAYSGKYTATFSNELGWTNTSVDVTIGYGPSFTCNGSYDVKENGNIRTECKPEGIPAPNITWYKDGKVIPSQQRWTKHDSGKYELKATNQYGTANHLLYLNVLFAPEFKRGNDTQEVTPGENVTLACSAEGKPVPEIQWNFNANKNVRETTGGRQKNVSITGATSTNDGVYICVATNNVGSVSRFVTLKIKGREVLNRGRRLSIIWWLLILCSLALLLIVIITLCRHQRKHGQYSFVPAAREPSDMPLTTMSGGDKA
ncbi:vascular cell adhesion protein 1 [Paralichthys olivaceus]|uniref:vascular cell adhesion protein 1 n=1 Tax=Paralichthys olivaceus TaxID=8255 RepID=UPI00097DB82A|nr:PREDICTED: intercellular adhesion molecule 5 [Paralichthys olivaceus]